MLFFFTFSCFFLSISARAQETRRDARNNDKVPNFLILTRAPLISLKN